jgi:hypothetical protein
MIIKKYTFKKDNKILLTQTKLLMVDVVYILRKLCATREKCKVNEVVVEIDEIELSDFDVSDKGMFDVNEEDLIYIKGLKLNVKIGSNTHLDSLLDGTLDKYIEFY